MANIGETAEARQLDWNAVYAELGLELKRGYVERADSRARAILRHSAGLRPREIELIRRLAGKRSRSRIARLVGVSVDIVDDVLSRAWDEHTLSSGVLWR